MAAKIGLSESGFKKMMTNTDISLSRLEQICKICGIDLIGLINDSDQEKIKDVFLSFEQEQYLLKNPKIFRFYWKLRVDQMTRSEFHKKFGVSLNETQKWLTGLEKIGLLMLNPRGQIEFTHQGLIRWNSDSALVKYLNSYWSRQLIDRVVERQGTTEFMNLSGLYLDEINLQSLKSECLELFERYSKLSQRLKNQNSAKRIGFLAAFSEFDFDLKG